MNRTNQILIAALVLQVGLVALVWSSGSSRKIAKLEPVIAIDKTAVTKLEIYDRLEPGKDKPTKPDVVVEKRPEGWVVTSHYDYPVKKNAADDLIGKLEAMKSRGPVATSESRQLQLRVAADRYERKVIIHAGGQPITLYVGSAAGRGKTAVRVEGATEIYGIPGLNAYGIGQAARSWVDQEYFVKGTDAITELTIQAANGNYTFRRADGDADWKRFNGTTAVPVPAGKELNDGAVDALASKVGRITLYEPADPAKKGFAPQATVTFKVGDKTHVLKIGDLADDRYLIEVDDKVPVLANKSMLESLVSVADDKIYREPPSEGDKKPADAPPQLPPGLSLPGQHP